MVRPTLEGLLFCWRNSLDNLWSRDPFSTQKHECFYVHFINNHRHSKRLNDGMIKDSIFSFSVHASFHAMEKLVKRKIQEKLCPESWPFIVTVTLDYIG